MSLTEKKKMKTVRNGLAYVNGYCPNPEPHWHAKYLWTKDLASLPNNRKAVEATFLRTEKQLAKDQEWRLLHKFMKWSIATLQ